MSDNILNIDDDKVICLFTLPDGEERSITFLKLIYEFLSEYSGDVHQWVNQQYDMIVRGQMKTPEAVLAMRRVRRGETLSQRAIGDLIRAHALSLYLTVKEGL